MEYDEGQIAGDGAGNFRVYRYGQWHPSDQNGRLSGPIDASSQWGAGARELPNGTIERVGPRGGVTVVGNNASGNEDGVGKLTEGQGKAVLYGGMMAGGERDYQAARAAGYNPAGIRNQIADIAGAIPFDGDFFGRLIRDDVSDRGRQAELRWAEGNLRQLTGAAATNPEISRVAAINFDRGNDQLAAQRYQSRADTYRGTRFAAGSGAAALPEYPYPNGVPTKTDQYGLPEYGIAPGREIDVGAAPSGPGSSPNEPFDFTTASRDEVVAAIQRGGWFRQGPDGQPYQLPPGNPEFGTQEGDQSISPDVAVRPRIRSNPDVQAGIEANSGVPGWWRGVESFAQGAAEQIPGLDEVAAWTAAQLSGVDYNEARAVQRDVSAYDRENYRGQRNAGGVAGATAVALTPVGAPVRLIRGGGAAVAGAGRLANAGRIAANTTNAAAGGSLAGAAWGFGQGEGNALERLPDLGEGALVGAAGGAAAPVIANTVGRRVIQPIIESSAGQFVGRQAGRVGNALNIPGSQRLIDENMTNPLTSGMRRFGDRSPQNINALNSEAARYQAETIAPTFADVINDGGRGTIRALATRQTPARQAVREFADGRAAGLQDRLSTQARRTISDDPRQPMQIREEITTARNARADQEFGAVRGDRIWPDRGVLEALRAPALRPAIEEAATSALNRGDNETAMMLRNLTDDALDYGADAHITVGMADRIARSLNGRAEAFKRSGNNDAAASYFALAERLRGGARAQSPRYDQALQSYAADSGLAQATELGEQFLTMEADQFAAAVARLNPEEQLIARAAARRAVERQGGTQGQAPGVAQRLANGREQAARTQALTGDAVPVQRAMGAELQTLRNAQGISPAQGSPTSMNAQDAMNAGGVLRAVTRPIDAGIEWLGNRLTSRGFSDAEAEAIGRAAIDPEQTRQLIAMLEQRMSRREARNLARAIRYQLTTAPQSPQQP